MVDVLSCNLETESGSSAFDPVILDGGGPQDMTLHGTVDIGAIAAEVSIDVFIDGRGPVDGGTFNMTGGENQYEIVTTLVDPEDSFWLPRAPGTADVSIEVTTPADVETFHCGTLQIESTPSPSIAVDECSLNPPDGNTVGPTDLVRVDVTVLNEGDASGEYTVRILGNGTVIDWWFRDFPATLGAGDTYSSFETFTPSDLGVGDGDELSIQVDVLGPGAATATPDLQPLSRR